MYLGENGGGEKLRIHGRIQLRRLSTGTFFEKMVGMTPHDSEDDTERNREAL